MRSSAAPGAFAFVMATGIVSADATEAGRRLLGSCLFWLAAAAYLVLAVRLALALLRGPVRFTFALFAVSAAGDVLAVVLAAHGHRSAAAALGGFDLAVWLALLAALAARRRSRERARGEWLLLVVATQSLAVVAATLASRRGSPLEPAALALLALGVALYPCVLAALVPRVRALAAAGAEGDDWILPGALAISALAAGRCALADGRAAWLVDATVALWALALLWLPLLVAAERVALAARLRRARAGARSWSRVFPLGMLAAATFAVARLLDVPALRSAAVAASWLALAVWALTVAGSALSLRAARSAPPPA